MHTFAAYTLLAVFFVAQRVLRRGAEARSLEAGAEDRGSTRALALAFLASALALAAAPALSRAGLGGVIPGWIGWTGAALSLIGIVIRIWAQLFLGQWYTSTLRHAEGQPVVTEGPYRWVRHPGYAGLLLAWAGAGLASGCWISAVVTVVVTAAAYAYRISVEEPLLVAACGDSYRVYMARTWRLCPFVY